MISALKYCYWNLWWMMFSDCFRKQSHDKWFRGVDGGNSFSCKKEGKRHREAGNERRNHLASSRLIFLTWKMEITVIFTLSVLDSLQLDSVWKPYSIQKVYHALNLDWRFVSHVIIYMFQCHSPISYHPCPLPQSPKDCSIHLCLFCCLIYKVFVLFSSVQLSCSVVSNSLQPPGL